MSERIIIDTALGGPWELIGDFCKKSGSDDASGRRRFIAEALARREYDKVARDLNITVFEAQELREQLVEEWGEPCLNSQ